jgi:hypothetical protein
LDRHTKQVDETSASQPLLQQWQKQDRDMMLGDELVFSAGDPDDYSEGSGNPDDDWDGNNVEDKAGSYAPFQVDDDSIDPGSASLWLPQQERQLGTTSMRPGAEAEYKDGNSVPISLTLPFLEKQLSFTV